MATRKALAAAPPRVVRLADSLQEEIATRGLEPGERFLTTVEAAREFRVSMALANRALQILAQHGGSGLGRWSRTPRGRRLGR